MPTPGDSVARPKWTGRSPSNTSSKACRSRPSCRSCGPAAIAKRARPPRQNGPSVTQAPTCKPIHAVPSLASERSASAKSCKPRPLLGRRCDRGRGGRRRRRSGRRRNRRCAGHGHRDGARRQQRLLDVEPHPGFDHRGRRARVADLARDRRLARARDRDRDAVVAALQGHARRRAGGVVGVGGDPALAQRRADGADQRRIAVEAHAGPACGGCVACRTDHRQRDRHAERDLDRRERAHPRS